MNYEGPLYGKCGRRYIPLRLRAKDVDNMDARNRQLEAENEWLRNKIGRIYGGIALERAKQRIIMVHNGTFPLPETDQLSPVHTSFKFDKP